MTGCAYKNKIKRKIEKLFLPVIQTCPTQSILTVTANVWH